MHCPAASVPVSRPNLKRPASALGAAASDDASRRVLMRPALPSPEVHTKTALPGKGFKHIVQSAFKFLQCRNAMRLLCCHRDFADVVHDSLQASSWASLLLPMAPARPLGFFTGTAKALYEWANATVLDAMQPVSIWSSNGLTMDEMREQHPGSVISMEEAKNSCLLRSDIAMLLAERSLSAAQSVCSDTVRQGIELLACRLRDHGEIRRCKSTTVSCTMHVEDDMGGGGGCNFKEEYDICLHIAVSRNSTVVLEMHAEYFTFQDSDGVDDETSEVEVRFKPNAADKASLLFSSGFFRESHYNKLKLDNAAVRQASHELLGDPDEGVVTLFVLWRLLCAPIMLWPRGESHIGSIVRPCWEDPDTELSEQHRDHAILRL